MKTEDYKTLTLVNALTTIFAIVMSFTSMSPFVGFAIIGMLMANCMFIFAQNRARKTQNNIADKPAVVVCKHLLEVMKLLNISQRLSFCFRSKKEWDFAGVDCTDGIQKMLKDKNYWCNIQVDIWGALFFSYIQLFPNSIGDCNITVVTQSFISGSTFYRFHARKDIVFYCLASFFDRSQLSLMRNAFYQQEFSWDSDRHLAEQTITFSKSHDPYIILEEILKNIIKNNGNFIPAQGA